MPETTEPAARRVGLPRRLAAIFYDSMALFAIFFFTTWLVIALAGGALPPGHPLLRSTLFALGCLFFAGFWSYGGQTLGMKSWRIRLVSDTGGPVHLGTALLRCMLALFSWACLGAGFWTALFDRERLTWHDRLSGTRLVRTDLDP
ncbi:MAG: RDD family protein [Gammaproteobacteria bacterium]|nr:RDD family protein [Gammaproteobacteria bacterium]